MSKKLHKLIKSCIEESHISFINTSYIDSKSTDEIIKFLYENRDYIQKNIYSSLHFDMGYMVKINWLDNFPATTKEFGYIISFKEAGDILVEHSQDVKADYMVYSVMFNYMQYLELAFKNILSYNNSKIPYTHDINDLWEVAKPIIKNKFKKNEFEILIIDSIIKSIFPKNSTSMNFRYKTDKQGNDNIPNTFTLDLYVVKIWIDIFDTIICDTYNT